MNLLHLETLEDCKLTKEELPTELLEKAIEIENIHREILEIQETYTGPLTLPEASEQLTLKAEQLSAILAHKIKDFSEENLPDEYVEPEPEPEPEPEKEKVAANENNSSVANKQQAPADALAHTRVTMVERMKNRITRE